MKIEKGDIVAAFFGHDHTNSFYGKTDEDIFLGCNASFGWKAYGTGSTTRQIKMTVVDEDDPTNPEIYSRTYTDLTGENGGFGPIDFISPWMARHKILCKKTLDSRRKRLIWCGLMEQAQHGFVR